MTELLKDKKQLLVNIALTLCYAIFTFFIVLHHELWVDEVQAWQIAKYVSLGELFRQLIDEGHPALFYLILMPFAKLNFSIFTVKIICWFSTVSGVFLLLQFSPFKWWCRLAIILSAGFLYFFPVIARSYSLLPPLIFITAILYKKRKEMPVCYALSVFLISQLHIIMLGFTSLLALFFGIETKKENKINKRTITAFSLMCVGIFYYFILLIGTMLNNKEIGRAINTDTVLIKKIIVEFFANTINDMSAVIIPLISVVLGIYFLYLIVLLYKKEKKIFWIVLLSVAFQLFLYATLYPMFVYGTRIFTAYLILIFGYWIVLNQNENKNDIKLNIFLSIFFLISTYNGLINCITDIKYPYSGSKQMAEYIKNNIDTNSVILYQNPNIMLPLIYYLSDYEMIYSPYGEKVKYIVWDQRLNKLMPTSSWTKFLTRFQNENPETKDKDIYILQVKAFYTPVENTEIIFVSEEYKANMESYVLMKLQR